jgi:hypothetical protein
MLTNNARNRTKLSPPLPVRMVTLEPRILDAVPRARRDAARWAAPGMAAGGAATGLLAGDACASGLALPVSGLALTVAGTLLWLTGLPRERRDRIALAIAAALALLSIGALQHLLVCMLGREAMLAADLLQAAGLALLLVALALLVHRRRRARAAVAAPAPPPAFDRPLARTVEATALGLARRHGLRVACDLSAGVEADDATRRALLRLLRTAIADAARRDATWVRVELRKGPRLLVTDHAEPRQAAASVRAGSGAAGARSASF